MYMKFHENLTIIWIFGKNGLKVKVVFSFDFDHFASMKPDLKAIERY